eukprot:3347737-Alexandrium_andersonii.AAC.1
MTGRSRRRRLRRGGSASGSCGTGSSVRRQWDLRCRRTRRACSGIWTSCATRAWRAEPLLLS